MVTEGNTNDWVVEGRAQCVVGTTPSRESLIFDIFVTKPKKPLKPTQR